MKEHVTAKTIDEIQLEKDRWDEVTIADKYARNHVEFWRETYLVIYWLGSWDPRFKLVK